MLAGGSLLLGIVAHLLDLLHTGGIVDYLCMPLGSGWAFNFGDVAIVIGGLLAATEYLAGSITHVVNHRPST